MLIYNFLLNKHDPIRKTETANKELFSVILQIYESRFSILKFFLKKNCS